MSTGNTEIARRWFEEVWNQHREQTIYELMAPDASCVAEAGSFTGHAGFIAHFYKPLRSAVPDMKVSVEAIVSDDANAVVRWSAKGTHTGEGLGFPATNAPIALTGMTWFAIKAGQITFGWQSSNIVDSVQKLMALTK
jgi:steroid delta-isomerase-like uncharacterized protein